jgi:cytochrome c oxidase subunit 2
VTLLAVTSVGDAVRRILFLPPQGSTLAPSLDALHASIIGTTMVVFTAISFTGIYFLVRYRRRTPGQRGEAIKGGTLYEVLTIGVPLSLFLLWFALGVRKYVELNSPPPDSMEIYVTAKQWMWKFEYPEGPISIGVLRVPVGRPVKLLMTSRDVIHSFFVPAFRDKKDVLPGRYTELWFQAREAGNYEVFCSQYCGTDHSRMRAQVVAVSEAEFDVWMAEQLRSIGHRKDAGGTGPGLVTVSSGSLIEQGQKLAGEKGCLKCHSVDGSPHIGPTWLGLYGREEQLEGGGEVIVDEAYMTESMMDPRAKVVAGFRPVMPTFQGVISDGEVAALIQYIKSLRDQNLQMHPSQEPVYEPSR